MLLLSPFLLLVIPPPLFIQIKSVQAPTANKHCYGTTQCSYTYNTHWYSTNLKLGAVQCISPSLPLSPSLPPSLPPSFTPSLPPSLPPSPFLLHISRRVTATKLGPNLLKPSQLTSSGCLFSKGSLHGVGWPPLFLPATDPRPRNPLCC